MPAVQYIDQERRIHQGRCFVPKRVTQELAWYKEARKVIPLIPNLEQSDWRLTKTEVSRQFIKFELHNSVGRAAFVTIDRQKTDGLR